MDNDKNVSNEKNYILNLMITPDKLKAMLSISYLSDSEVMIGVEELENFLAQNRVVFGIKKDVLNYMANTRDIREPLCVAEGYPAVNGQNGTIKFFFDVEREIKPALLEDGRVDYRNLNLIQIVRKGDVLCTVTPPTNGKNGMTVTGEIIKALNGKPYLLPKGKNVSVSEDGHSLISDIDGQIVYADNKVSVFSVYEVPADVDNSTGNIDFVGNVIVRGNVLSGFLIKAGGSIEIWGVVEAATLIAEGDIVLRTGMQGMGKGLLKSGHDIVARYIENGYVEAANDIKAEAIMHSFVKCGNKLELSGRKGLLVGGNAKVGREVVVKVIGSHMATSTEVEVGVDPSVRERYKSLRLQLSALEGDYRKAEQAIQILKKFEEAGVLTPDKQEMMNKSIKTKVYLTTQINEIRNELMLLEEKLQMDTFGKIKCYNYIYPGTKVSIGSSMLFIKEVLQYCTLYRDGADIRVGPIDK